MFIVIFFKKLDHTLMYFKVIVSFADFRQVTLLTLDFFQSYFPSLHQLIANPQTSLACLWLLCVNYIAYFDPLIT
jgi:hypothetical protein